MTERIGWILAACSMATAAIALASLLINAYLSFMRAKRQFTIDLMRFWIAQYYADFETNAAVRTLLEELPSSSFTNIEHEKTLAVSLDHEKSLRRLLQCFKADYHVENQERPPALVVANEELRFVRSRIVRYANLHEAVAAGCAPDVCDETLAFHEFYHLLFSSRKFILGDFIDATKDRYPALRNIRKRFSALKEKQS